jgi:paraquat-inducible protein B
MTEQPGQPPSLEDLPSAQVRHPRISAIWIVPILAAGLVAYLAYLTFTSRGPSIVVSFKTADGLREEQTQVKHKSVPLGTVERIELSDKADHVDVHIRMTARAEPMITDKARFWVVRPRLTNGPVAALQTGLETLLSGAYIELDPGSARGGPQEVFKGLELPPTVRSGQPGTVFVLRAAELGSLSAGAPIMLRRVSVGEVLDFELNHETGEVAVRAFVHAPHDELVRQETCFWSASGLALSMGAEGLHLQVESMRTMFSGGIAFRTPVGKEGSPRAESGHVFPLYGSEAAAEVQLHAPSIPYVAYFQDSVEGLAPGSAVQMFGLQVGNVTALDLMQDPHEAEHNSVVRVRFVLQPQRAFPGHDGDPFGERSMREHIRRGMRVALETRSLLTGEKVLSLVYVKGRVSEPVSEKDGTLVIPSQSHSVGALTGALSELATRLNQIPYEEIGLSLQNSLQSVESTLEGKDLKNAIVQLGKTLAEAQALAHEARAGLAPAFARLPKIAADLEQAVGHANEVLGEVGAADSELRRSTQRLMTQAGDMARSIRLLADYLQQHPETLIRGRKDQESP